MLRDLIIDSLSRQSSRTDPGTGMKTYEDEVLLMMQDDILRSPSCIAAVGAAQGFSAKRAAVEKSASFQLSLFGSFDIAYSLAVGKWAGACDAMSSTDAMAVKRRVSALAEASSMVKSHVLSSHDDAGSAPSPARLLAEPDNRAAAETLLLLAQRHAMVAGAFRAAFGEDSFVSSSWNTDSDPWLAAADNALSAKTARCLGFDGPKDRLSKALGRP